MKKQGRPQKYSDDDLFEIAMRYDTRKKFNKECANTCNMLRTRGLLDGATAHMDIALKGLELEYFGLPIWDRERLKPKDWNDDRRAEAAKTAGSTIDFINRSPDAYLSIKPGVGGSRMLTMRCLGFIDPLPKFKNTSKDHIKRAASWFTTVFAFQAAYPTMYRNIKDSEFERELAGHLDGWQARERSLDGDVERMQLQEVANKYVSRKAFSEAEGEAHSRSIAVGLYHEVTAHMGVTKGLDSNRVRQGFITRSQRYSTLDEVLSDDPVLFEVGKLNGWHHLAWPQS